MYLAFRRYRDEQLSTKERAKLYQELLQEKESLFALHPTFAERIKAVEMLPRAHNPDPRPALQLFEQPEEIEKKLTDFLTEHMARR